MKKNIVKLCMLGIISVFLCSSCGLFGDQKYICEIDKVESIQIIRLGNFIQDEDRYEYTTLSQISDYESFVDRLNKINHSVNWGEPGRFNEHNVVIRINYNNNDFDLIHPDAQCFYHSGKEHYGYFFFDDEQFEELISDYIDKTDDTQ